MASEIHGQLSAQDWQVPSFEKEVLKDKASKYVIIIPVINEGERIKSQLRDMAQQGICRAIDTVIVDGGSTDGSLALDFLKDMGTRALLTKTGPGKLSAQLRCGYAWALTEGYDGIITVDGNGKDGVDAVPKFAEALDSGHGYVQASRFIPGGRSENIPLSRYLAIRFIHAPLQSLAAKHWFTDTTQGFRAYSRDYLLNPGTQPFREVFTKYELLAYLTIRASQLGYPVTELPTSRVYPANEPVPTKIKGLSPLLELLSVLFKALFGVYHPKSGQTE
ncbi:MAG: glycosyltransferase family 2 protein [Parasphingorhabdus sp.]|uniref:glycosyltransferase family 2 protein n=1 Tax=Parasphingorhabdus sp. TaxID=2709688 RepID=UPI00329789CF